MAALVRYAPRDAAYWCPMHRLPLSCALISMVTCGFAQVPAWVPLPTTPSTASQWVWDSARGRVVAIDTAAPYVWEWDGRRWDPRLGAAGGPTGFVRTVYDPHRRVVIAGVGEWDGSRWMANNLAFPGIASSGTFAFDTTRRRLVATANGAVFEWDGAVSITMQPANGPGAGGAFAYDPVHQRCVLYGGTAGDECWSWNGAAWSSIANACPPGPRSGAVLAFDPISASLVLYGGTSNTTTWRLSGSTFAPVATTRDPGSRVNSQLVFDGQGMLLGGGSSSHGGELWRLANGDWTELPGGSPMARSDAAFAWDPLRGNAVLFGGYAGHQPYTTYFGDTWTFDGQWHQHHGPAPAWRISPPFAWSAANAAVMLHDSETWFWNGAAWTQIQPATTPPVRWWPALVPDPSGGVLLFGGQDATNAYLNDTWLWNGTTWTQLAPSTAPSPRIPLAAHDPLRNVVVVAAGLTSTTTLQDTWEWNGAQWTQRSNTPFLVGTRDARLAWNPLTGRVRAEVFGQYEWDGAAWATIALWTQGPFGPSFVADLAHGRTLRCSWNERSIAVLTVTPSNSERYGTGCAIGPAPGLTTIGRPSPGASQFALDGLTYAPGAPAFIAIGLTSQNQPLGSGCSSLVGTLLAVDFVVASAAGHATLSVPIPATPDLRGVSFTAQLAVVDAQRGLYGGLAISEGLRTTIGD